MADAPLAGGDPAAWLTALDRLVAHEAGDETFVTACVGILDPGSRRLLLASAGHPAPILIGTSTAAVEVSPGPPLGLALDVEPTWATEAVALDLLFSVVLYTDGLVEGRRAPGSPVRYGEQSLPAWIGGAASADHRFSRQDVERLLEDVEAADGGPMTDDVSVVVLTGSSGAVQPPTSPVGEPRGAVAPQMQSDADPVAWLRTRGTSPSPRETDPVDN